MCQESFKVQTATTTCLVMDKMKEDRQLNKTNAGKGIALLLFCVAYAIVMFALAAFAQTILAFLRYRMTYSKYKF